MDYKYYKYLKYKHKYINLKQGSFNTQLGGGALSFITRDAFNERFAKHVSLGLLHEFYNLYRSIKPSPELHILVGASNIDDNDFNRFRNSIYNFFIDKFSIDDTNREIYRERLYDMFTINNNKLDNTDWSASEITYLHFRFLQSNFIDAVDSLCTDLNTAYFLDRQVYLNLAYYILKVKGEFIFHHAPHYGNATRYDNNKLKWIIREGYVEESLSNYFDIDREAKTQFIKDEHILKVFDSDRSNLLSPNFNFFIVYMDDKTHSFKNYETNLYEAYGKYLSIKYTQFAVSTHVCDLMDFTYPVPIPNLSSTFQLTLFKFIINSVMNDYERRIYLETHKIDEAKLRELIDRCLQTEELISKFNKEHLSQPLNKATFADSVISEFKHKFHYVKLKKLVAVGP